MHLKAPFGLSDMKSANRKICQSSLGLVASAKKSIASHNGNMPRFLTGLRSITIRPFHCQCFPFHGSVRFLLSFCDLIGGGNVSLGVRLRQLLAHFVFLNCWKNTTRINGYGGGVPPASAPVCVCGRAGSSVRRDSAAIVQNALKPAKHLGPFSTS